MVKILKLLGNLIIVLIIVGCLPLAIPRIIGIQEFNVVSGSMEPEISIGSIVYVKPVAFNDLQQGDVIAFDSGASVVTHRIESIDTEDLLIHTKGDANAAADFMPVAYKNVRGRVIAHFPLYGKLAALISETTGKIVAFILLIVGILLSNIGEKRQSEKTDSTKGPGRINPKIILALGIVIVCGSLGGFAYMYMGYQKSENLYDSLEQSYVKKAEDVAVVQDWTDMIDVDLAALSDINPDVIGWLYVEGTDISYPILFSGDDETYLRTTLDKEYATAGSIFLEGYNLADLSDCHNIIYGHNMRNLSMFGKLKFYKTEEDFYEQHKYFQIITKEGKRRFEIFSYFDTEPASWVYTVPYYDNLEFQKYIDDLVRYSYKKTGLSPASDHKIITLSTCSSEGMRFTVHGYECDSYLY